MDRGMGLKQLRRPTRRAPLLAFFAATAIGCGALVGVDFDKAQLGSPNEDGGKVVVIVDGSTAPVGDAGPSASACTPDPNAVTCADKCGEVQDNCDAPRACAGACGLGKTCTAGKCECVSEGSWCLNRCDQTTDNCGRPVSCGSCDGGVTCALNSCGCTPDPVSVACGGKSCGTAINNCGQLVACGASGACTTAGATCQADGGCCADDGTACAGKCGGVMVTNNCQQNVGCPVDCPAGQACSNNLCCVPEPLATTCAGVLCGPKTNNCGQVVTCPDTCAAPQSCGGGGTGPNGCGCTPTTDNCGLKCAGTGTNNCGQTVACTQDCDVFCCNGGYCGANMRCQCQGPIGKCL
jgi:hypothetical protein